MFVTGNDPAEQNTHTKEAIAMKTTANSRQSARTATRKLMFQNLEARSMMAGDVTAAVVGGDLVLTGDNQDNAIVVKQFLGNQFLVAGLNADGSPTTINGQANQLFTFNGDLRVQLNGGDDVITLDKPQLLNPIFGVSTTKFPGAVSVEGNNGNDKLILRDVSIRETLDVDMGNGDDLVQGTNVEIGLLDGNATNLNGNVTILMGEDEDTVNFSQLDVDGLFQVDLGSEDNDDEVFLMQDSTLNAGLLVATGRGDDSVTLRNSKVETVVVVTDDGEDVVNLEFVTVDQIFADLGDGDDVLNTRRLIARRMDAIGGDGDDEFTFSIAIRELNKITDNRIFEFEVIRPR
ncbi:hypothetical protein Psta_0103 [Pirellula staleyi DSM 6068]|uniref:Uncharacterized protein n=1 Tax=Pirellula staleyi (strain ATCC 27377 / DSM 6068 / ICPB 4128) TaxID=530564 RepID=D2R0D1_PIRSD|nr:hypothetical protein Psta_0103 [Pirellula staleyi DSM 6068]